MSSPAARDPGRLERQEVEAFLDTRRELGAAYEKEVVDAFADRIERVLAERTSIDAHELRRRRDDERGDRQRQLALGIVSLGASIPITIPLAVTDHPGSVVVSWIGIVGVNVAHAWVVNARRFRQGR